MKRVLLILGLIILVGFVYGAEMIRDTGENDLSPYYRVSGSPYLRLPESMKNWPAVSLPELEELPEESDPGEVVEYNALTKKVVRYPIKENLSNNNSNSSSYLGLLSLAFRENQQLIASEILFSSFVFAGTLGVVIFFGKSFWLL